MSLSEYLERFFAVGRCFERLKILKRPPFLQMILDYTVFADLYCR
jgi:hypothetical protein